MKKYTLDQIISGKYVFLELPDEVNQLLISEKDVQEKLAEGDIVAIDKAGNEYIIQILEAEKEITLKKVNALLEKLQNK